MSHGIETTRDFVLGIGENRDWHGLTQKREKLGRSSFPEFTPHFIEANGKRLPWQVLMTEDDGGVCGAPFNPDSFGYILPQKAFDLVTEALSGTGFTVERVGMLWNRSFWFVSVSLDELKTVSREGEAFRLNFSGALDGSDSPQGELGHIRAVCWNTISLSRASGKRLFRIRQSKNSFSKLDQAKADVEAAVGMAAVFNKTLDSLKSKPATELQARQAFAGEVARAIVKTQGGDLKEAFATGTTKSGAKRESRALGQVDDLVSLFQSGDGNKGESRADILNGFTQLHTRGGMADSTKNPWKAIASSEFGNGAERKARFLTTLENEKEFKGLLSDGKTALALV